MASEETLFDRTGSPIAYVATDGSTIYLWSGIAVAYFHSERVYGWNGKHLGSFHNGVIYDASGLRIGFTGSKCPSATRMQPNKSVKRVRSVKSVRNVASIRPIRSLSNSNQPLEDFLRAGQR